MALITCPECANSISEKASKCPKCGAPTEKSRAAGWVLGIVAAVILLPVIIGSLSSDPKNKMLNPDNLRLTRVAQIATAVKNDTRNPGSVTFATVLANSDASTVCIFYRTQNEFGGMEREDYIVYKGGSGSDSVAWNAHCKKGMTDLTSEINNIRL